MKQRYILPLLLSFALLPSLISCYGNNEIEKDGIFKCTSDEQCVKGYRCDRTTQFCVERAFSANENECIDDDKDGFGPESLNDTQRANCRECQLRQKCDVDPDDGDPSVYPGAIDFCDGVDNDGDGTIDGDTPCKQPSDCSLSEDLRNAVLKNVEKKHSTLTENEKSDIKKLLSSLVSQCSSGKCQWQTRTLHPVACDNGVPKAQ